MKLALLIAILALVGCTSGPDVPKPPIAGKFSNACLVESVQMVQGLNAHGITAKVVAYTYGGTQVKTKGHAITVYLYPPGHNQVWGWDSWNGSVRLREYYSDTKAIAERWHMISRSNGRVIEATDL